MRRAALVMGLAMLPWPASGAEAPVMVSSGTGFFINREGYLITSYHVVRHCSDMLVQGAVPLTKARLVAGDIGHDLALLETRAMPIDRARLSSAKQPLHPSDPVVVIGYPGKAWQTGEPLTREARIISATGPKLDNSGSEARWLRFSDSLAEGNSGGPLLDGSGNVVGVVAAKGKLVSHNATDNSQETLEQFDLAISLPVLRQFLEANDMEYEKADSGILLTTGRIEDDARRFIASVRCKIDKD